MFCRHSGDSIFSYRRGIEALRNYSDIKIPPPCFQFCFKYVMEVMSQRTIGIFATDFGGCLDCVGIFFTLFIRQHPIAGHIRVDEVKRACLKSRRV
jgi:hypothetical protein